VSAAAADTERVRSKGGRAGLAGRMIGDVPEPAAQSGNARRKALAREAERRRRAVTMLQISEATCRYAASALANGTGPDEARQTALFVAGELEQVAAGLRRLTRLPGPERRVLAVQLHGFGWTTKRIAAQLGVTPRCVRYYLAGRVCPGRTTAR